MNELTPIFIDTHAHLTDKAFESSLPEMVSEFLNNSIAKVFTVGYDLPSSKDCVALSEKYKNVYAIVGIHPSDIETLNPQTLEWLTNITTHPKVLAIGEIGLDYHYTSKNKQIQKEGFVKQLHLAHAAKLPIIIHTRDASEDLLLILKQYSHLLTNGGIVHCFSEKLEFYQEIEKLGLIISLGGALTFKNAQSLQDTVKNIPLSKIVLETDCPYLTPVPFRGQVVNEPKFVPLIAQKLAEIKQVSLKEISDTTTKNVYQLFKKLKD